NIRTRFVDHHLYIVSLCAQLPIAALNNLAVILFRLDYQQQLVHESRHSPRWTRLVEWRHVENDVVEVARFHIWHHIEESFQADLCRTSIWGAHGSEVEIIRS